MPAMLPPGWQTPPSMSSLGTVVWGGDQARPAWNPGLNRTLAQTSVGTRPAPTAGLGGPAAQLGAAAVLPLLLGATEGYWRPPVERGIETAKGYGSRALSALRQATGF